MAGRNILVADNETGVVELLETLLQRDGHRVFAARNGREAVETVRKNPVDLAVLALTMPVMSGLEALRAIKEIDPNVEIVMMTAYTDLDCLRQLLHYGAFDFLVKPFGMADISDCIRNALEKRTIEQQNRPSENEMQEKTARIGRAAGLLDNRGQAFGVVGETKESGGREQAEERARYLINHDLITGLYNRAFFEAEMSRLDRGRLFPVSVILLYPYELQETVDHHGSRGEERLLREAAMILRRTFRAEDVLARIEHLEFAVLLPGVDTSAVDKAVIRVGNQLQRHNMASRGSSLRLSVGTATAQKPLSLSRALREARNKVIPLKINLS